jgi:hypothetical protein
LARLRLLAALLFGLCGSTCLAAAPLDVVRECAQTAAPNVTGLKNLVAACPRLEGALTELGLDRTLFNGWQEKLNGSMLHDVVDLAERYSAPKGKAGPSTASLRAVLDSLQNQAPKTESWWQTLKARLKQWLANSNSSIASWLNRFLDRWQTPVNLSGGFLKALSYGLTALAVIGALIVILRELRAAGIGRRKSGRAHSDETASDKATRSDPGVVAALARDRITELLRALVQRLAQTGRLKADRSLTHRELVARSIFESEAQRAAFASVAAVAESVLYGSREASPDVLERTVRQGAALLLQLSASNSAF